MMFQHLMFVAVYSDDMLVLSWTLQQAGLKLKQTKCHFVRKEVEYFGHLITPGGLRPNPRLVEAVPNFPTQPLGQRSACSTIITDPGSPYVATFQCIIFFLFTSCIFYRLYLWNTRPFLMCEGAGPPD